MRHVLLSFVQVCYKEHTPEKCLCTYLLFWQHGPEEGNTTVSNLDDIYFIKHGPVDPTVVNFANLAKEKIEKGSFEFTLIPKNPLLFHKASSNETITKSQTSFSVNAIFSCSFLVYDFRCLYINGSFLDFIGVWQHGTQFPRWICCRFDDPSKLCSK